MSTTLSLPADRKIGDIQVLRGIAVAAVVFHHLLLSTWLSKQTMFAYSPSTWLAVDLFFVISGFVITGALIRDRFEPLAFLVKRAFRLLPALAIFVGICLALSWYFSHREMNAMGSWMYVMDGKAMRKMALSVLGGYYTLQQRQCALFGGMWSLSLEDQFYIGMALICLLGSLVFRRHARRVLPKLVLLGAGSLFLFVMALRMEMLFIADGRAISKLEGYVLIFRADLLALGVLLAFLNHRFGPRIAAFFEDRGPFLSPFLLMTPFVLTALTGPTDSTQTMSRAIPVTGFCFGLLTLAAAHNCAFPARRGALYRLGNFLGDRSYSIYLFHFTGLAFSWILIDRFFPAHSDMTVTLLAIGLQLVLVPLCTLPLVELVYRKVELPLTAVGRRLAKRVHILPSEPRREETQPTRIAA